MANLRISRIGGFSFGNFTINNTKDVFLIEVIKDATPSRIVYNDEINQEPIFTEKYNDISIIVKIGISGEVKEDYRIKQREIITAVYGKEDRLQFNDDTGLYYIASVNKTITVEEGYPFNILTITFDVFKPYLYKDNESIMLKVGENIIQNEGNAKSYPIIKLNGTGSITINGIYVEVYNEPVYIDSEKEIIYRLDSNGKKLNHMKFVFGNTFVVLKSGLNYIYMDGSEGVTAEISYKHTYIG